MANAERHKLYIARRNHIATRSNVVCDFSTGNAALDGKFRLDTNFFRLARIHRLLFRMLNVKCAIDLTAGVKLPLQRMSAFI